MNFITNYESWLAEYRKDKYKIWIRATLSNDVEVYLPEYKDWLSLKTFCKDAKLGIKKVGLQYRSHSIEVDTTDTDGVYLVRSLVGVMGETSRQTITIGKLYGTQIHKSLWVTPELMAETNEIDDVENCFKEALILNYEQEETKA
jgi:hypothetical protein